MKKTSQNKKKLFPSKSPKKSPPGSVNLVAQEQINELEIGPNLTSSQKLKLNKLIQDNADIFVKDGTDLGRTSLIQHKINTEDVHSTMPESLSCLSKGQRIHQVRNKLNATRESH